MSTNTDKVDWNDSPDWNEEFSDIFSVNMDAIYFADDTDVNITFQKPVEYNEELEMYEVVNNEISIQYADSKKSIKYTSPAKLYINQKALPVEKMKSDDTTITLNSKTFTDYLFKYEPKNNQITKSLQQILDLLDSNKHGITDYSEFLNKFDDLLIENEMGYIKSVHAEMISSVLVREDDEYLRRPDFSKEDVGPLKIIRISKADMLAPLAVSLSFERIPEQLVDLNTYEKSENSMMDFLFR